MFPRLFIGVLFLIFSYSREVQATGGGIKQGYYTIVTPGTLQSQSVFHVSISLSEFHKSCSFNLILKKIDTFEKIHEFEKIEVHPSTTKLVKLRAPILEDKLGHLRIIVNGGIFNVETATIRFENNSISTFIQTNKAKYKPGELVQFRVICIDQLTRPAQVNQRILILIYDGQENVIKHISDVVFVQGVFKGEFQLSNYPVLGEWKIKVEIDGDDAAEKGFEVARYSLPRFLVSIETKPNVVIDEEKIVLEISARYFYSEPVQGNLTILLNNTYAAFQDRIPILRRQSQIHEKTKIVVGLKDDLRIKNKDESGSSVILFKFKAEAIVIDDLSGQMSRTEVEIAIHSKPFKIKLQAPKVFGADKFLDFKVKVFVTDLEERPVKDNATFVKIVVECDRPTGFDIEPFKSEYKHKTGIQFIKIKVENQNFSECSLYAEYKGCKSSKELIRKTENSIRMDILTESPEVGKELEVKIKANGPIGNFSYEILSRGDIIEAQHIKVPENRTTFSLSLNVTYAMVPKITIYVHRINKYLFEGQLKDVYIKRAFENSIRITTNEETKPGASLYINVTTDEGSYVGLMGLDQKILQDSNKEHDLTEDHLYTRLRNYDPLTIDSRSYPGAQAGLVTFSNAITDPDVISIRIDGDTILADLDYKLPEEFDKPSLELPRIRKLFSDSWLYKDFERTPAGGFNVMETVPDTITSWAITGFSLNPNTGLILTRNATNFKVFQEFFVSMDLPSLVKEGETIEVPVYISNYMSQDAQTNVSFESDSKDLKILEYPETVTKPMKPVLRLIPASKTEKIIFFIKPRKPGQFNVTVKAISPVASDAIKKILHVDSEGIPYEISKTSLIHFPGESKKDDEITIDIPANVVPGSQSIEISVVGDIFRPLMKTLEKLASFPSGNGEENMKIIISNVLALNYLKALNYSNPSLEKNIKLHIERGCQDQLAYKHLDGSFALFYDSNERTGDIWQTALALWALKQAEDFIHVDLEVFKRGWRYLQSKQYENGCFKSNKDIEEDVKYTALALMVFLMDEHSRTNYRRAITKGLAYLYKISAKLRRSSISFMLAYVLELGKHEKAADCLQKLTANASLTNMPMLWEKSDNLQARLEMTAGSLMNLFSSQKQPKQDLLHIVRGLINPEKEQSSLTHLLSLQAMIVFVEELNLKNINLNINFKDDKKISGDFQINSENSQVLQTVKLSQNSRKINLRSKGYGFGVVDVKIKYNIVPENQTSGTHLAITSRSISKNLNGLEICLNIFNNGSLSELTIMEVSLQSGHIFTKSDLEIIKEENEVIKSAHVSSSQDKVVIYFENVDNNAICFNLEALNTFKVFNAKPGWIILYDARTKDQKIAQSFKIKDS